MRLGWLFIGLGLLVMLHHYLVSGKWFEFEDLHHETFIVMFIFAGLVLLLKR